MEKPAKVIFLDAAGCPPLPRQEALAVYTQGAEYCSVDDPDAVGFLIERDPKVDVFVSNFANPNIFSRVRELSPSCAIVLVTDLPMDRYSEKLAGREEQFLDHVIAYRKTGTWLNDELRVTLQKILRHDYFGIEKYLTPVTEIHEVRITSSGQREQYNDQVHNFAEDCRLGVHLAKSIWGICEEMLMNAIYDAPHAAGIARIKNMPRSARIELEPHEQSVLRFGCDGNNFALSVTDPFGLMTLQKLSEYAKKIIRRNDASSIIDSKAGGAGLGLFKILHSSHSLIFNVEQGKRTEVISLIEIHEQLRDFSKMPRSIHFFGP